MDTSTAIVEALPFLIPIFAILTAPLIMFIWFRFESRKREETQKTLRAMIDSGQQITPEVLERLNGPDETPKPVNRREKDFRWGVILLALGIGFALYGVFDNGFGPRARLDEVMESLGIASIFLVIGVARLALWKYASREERQARASQ